MSDYNFWADALNKFSQLTPWVQVSVAVCFGVVVTVICYAIMRVLIALFSRNSRPIDVREIVIYPAEKSV